MSSVKLKHWQGYGTVDARRVKDPRVTLHVKVSGNHEWGLRRDDLYDVYNWLVKRFDRDVQSYDLWIRDDPVMWVIEGEYTDPFTGITVDTCDYYFNYQ